MRTGRCVVRSSFLGTKGSGPLSFVLRHWPGTKDNRLSTQDDTEGGFTLLELMVVLTLLLILASFAFPTYRVAIVRAREAVLRDDLYTMRSLIDQFTLDKQRPPQSLDELVDAGYLRGGVPEDPFTRSNQTWQVDLEDVAVPGSSQGLPGIVDVHSGSDEISLDGTPYSSW
jgi:general secretion pathway protein G